MNDDSRAGRLRVHAPLGGWCFSLDDSPDPVFRDRVLGDGVSIDPAEGDVRAPFDGEVVAMPDSRHAINLRADDGVEVMIHVGIDTVALKGKGFTAHVRAGDRVSQGQKLLSFEMDEVLRSVPSLRTPVILLDSERCEIRPGARGRVEAGDVIFEVWRRPEGAPASAASAETRWLTRTVKVGLAHGIHARPAAAIIAAIRSLDVQAQIRAEDGRSADARSAVAMMALGIAHGRTVIVAAQGPDAERALAMIVPALEPAAARGSPVPACVEEEPVAMEPPPPQPGAAIRARPVGSGVAIGTTIRLDAMPAASVAATGVRDAKDERERLREAVSAVRDFLLRLSQSRSGTGSDVAAAHLALLEDPQIAARADARIAAGESAASAWQAAIDESAAALQRLDDERLRERVDDLQDVNYRVQRVLAGRPPDLAAALPDDAIVIARTLLPSQLLELDRARLRGICTAGGGTTSHVAILAESMQIPMLVAAGNAVLGIADGSTVCVDADFGELRIEPDTAASARLRERIEVHESRRESERASAADLCVTADGVTVRIYANLATIADADEAAASGADGCGLLRTEFLFTGRSTPPGVDEQQRVYQRISDALGDRPVTVRLLDAGGDKPIPYLRQPAEHNPALGMRGVRLLLEHRRLLTAQLEALLRVERAAPLKVMIPMVSSVDEVEAVRAALDDLKAERAADNPIELGIMIETPAAALLADEFALLVDFFSIGTNDLTQYTLAMDRDEPRLAPRMDALDPAVLRLVEHTADAARRHGKSAGVCGAAAGDPLAAPVLLGLGVRELSVSPRSVARVKARLRELRIEDCSALAGQAVRARSADSVRTLARDFLDR